MAAGVPRLLPEKVQRAAAAVVPQPVLLPAGSQLPQGVGVLCVALRAVLCAVLRVCVCACLRVGMCVRGLLRAHGACPQPPMLSHAPMRSSSGSSDSCLCCWHQLDLTSITTYVATATSSPRPTTRDAAFSMDDAQHLPWYSHHPLLTTPYSPPLLGPLTSHPIGHKGAERVTVPGRSAHALQRRSHHKL